MDTALSKNRMALDFMVCFSKVKEMGMALRDLQTGNKLRASGKMEC